jgi:hypothetical protein
MCFLEYNEFSLIFFLYSLYTRFVILDSDWTEIVQFQVHPTRLTTDIHPSIEIKFN